MTEASSKADGITLTRIFDAPRELVFQAWTEPRHFAAWFGGAESEIPLDTVTMDVRVGGQWRITMLAGPERMELPFFGEYVEVSPPDKLVLTLSDGSSDGRELVTVTFAQQGDKTEMVFHQGGGNLTTEQYQGAKEGWSAFFDALADELVHVG
jgi:uncharacterized protein YndB with AHSA1/START domain